MELLLFKHNRPDRSVTFDEYCDEGGFAALKKAIAGMSPDEVQQSVIDSGLRGRGGAGFPTGKKWSFVPRNLPGPRWLICNCDEMEPGTYKDRVLLEHNPYSLIEGMTLACYALGVRHAFIFVRRGYEKAAENLTRALIEAKEAGFLGERILGSEISVDLDLHLSAGRYICGEETALINALEGKRPNPRSKPPFPAIKGLWDGPTVVNNVETLANVPAIVANGPAWFKGLALNPEGAGTKLFCVSGAVKNRVCVELPIGTTLRQIIDGPCGGMAEGKKFKACIPGGRFHPVHDPGAVGRADGLRYRRQGRLPAGLRRHHRLRGGVLPGGRDAQPDHLLRKGVLRLVHPVQGRAPLREGDPGKDRGRRGRGAGHRHPARAREVPVLCLLRLRAGCNGTAGWAPDALRGRGEGAYSEREMPVQGVEIFASPLTSVHTTGGDGGRVKLPTKC